MTTTLLYAATAACLVGAAFCFRQAYREAREPMTAGWIHVSPVEDDSRAGVAS
ncbi:hypothetical protein AB0M61_01870 [Streptomyces sp. NPDC051642]|uniref:hypothetical protein n=1 Tax=Streptomyces sp. NPDC051642 TaxID=3154646 RepID=UPI0034156D08